MKVALEELPKRMTGRDQRRLESGNRVAMMPPPLSPILLAIDLLFAP